MPKQIISSIIAVLLILASVLSAGAESLEEPTIDKIIAELDAEQFGHDAVVARDSALNVLTVNEYPAHQVNAALNNRNMTGE